MTESKQQNSKDGRTEQKEEGAGWPVIHSRAEIHTHRGDTGELNLIHPGSISARLTLHGVNLTGS